MAAEGASANLLTRFVSSAIIYLPQRIDPSSERLPRVDVKDQDLVWDPVRVSSRSIWAGGAPV
jgi:hypothetical protein